MVGRHDGIDREGGSTIAEKYFLGKPSLNRLEQVHYTLHLKFFMKSSVVAREVGRRAFKKGLWSFKGTLRIFSLSLKGMEEKYYPFGD